MPSAYFVAKAELRASKICILLYSPETRHSETSPTLKFMTQVRADLVVGITLVMDIKTEVAPTRAAL